ncbi:5-formyltetrahydrofolate cyclo-ligase [Cupriavidus sp. 30B13]|uniref:5-formyltetrahydrofolate cyclo-ligase n=1 Tax=Cupriavidus sp. 30B13 TaxID=3384241 RepID=UPI003B8F32D9
MPSDEVRDRSGEERNTLRRRLLALRAALPARAGADAAVEAALAALLERQAVRRLGFYWPIQHEFDARPAVMRWLAAAPGRQAALPVVSRPGAPLDFHLWEPGTAMATGRYGIPVPDGTPAVLPDALLIPCVGFSSDKFRLGYGGGFYDRTLAALAAAEGTPPVAIGIGFEACRTGLLPQEHDVGMDWVVSEAGVF